MWHRYSLNGSREISRPSTAKTTSEPMIMTEEDKKNFRVATMCWLCNEALGEDNVRDYCHFTGKYRGAAPLSAT